MIKWSRRRAPPVRLETERFVLQSLKRRELAQLSFPWTDDPKVMEPLELKTGGWTLRTWEKTVLKPNNRDKFAFGIQALSESTAIGYETAQISSSRVAILGVVIGNRDWWGRGVVAESRAAVLDFLFGETSCARAWGITHARNFPSISNYLALGFQHEGTLRGQFLLPDDGRADSMVFGILREEWLSRRSRESSDDQPG